MNEALARMNKYFELSANNYHHKYELLNMLKRFVKFNETYDWSFESNVEQGQKEFADIMEKSKLLIKECEDG